MSYRIAVVIKTDGLEFDDRVRKEILTIQKLYPDISFKIFAMLPDNREFEGVTSYGTPFKSLYIPAREKYGAAEKVLLKAFQFYRVVKKDLSEYDAVWAADIESVFVPFLIKNKRMLWDLHELPSQLMSGSLKKRLLRFVFSRCRIVLHANPQRAEYLEKQGVITNMKKHYSLRNYPNFADVDKKYDDKYHSFITWKGDRRCVYLQGLDGDWRAAYESITSVMKISGIVAVVVGPFNQTIKEKLINEYEDELEKRILFIGRIPQLKIPQYVKECFTTLVFYKNVSPNNYYCEANRFYQSVIMGLPVVVGNNPPMRDLVNSYGLGVSIDDDGNDINKIVAGLKEIIDNYSKYKIQNEKNRNKLVWDNQENTVKEIVNYLFID